MIDYMAIGLVIFFGVMGMVAGSLLQLLRLASAIFSIIVTLKYAPVIADTVPVLGNSMMMREYGLPVLLFAIIYMLVVMIIKLLLKMTPVGDVRVGCVSRVFGGFFGTLNGLLLTYFIVAVALNAQVESGRKLVVVDTEDSVFVKYVVEHPIKGLTERSPDDVDAMKVKIKQFADDAADKMGEMKESALKKADQIKDKASDLVDQAGEKVEEAAEDAADKAADTALDVKDKVVEAGDDVADKASEAGEKAEDIVDKAEKKVGEAVDGSK